MVGLLKIGMKSWNAGCARNRKGRKGFLCVPCVTFARFAFQLFIPIDSVPIFIRNLLSHKHDVKKNNTTKTLNLEMPSEDEQ
jgi:hypothetical protein